MIILTWKRTKNLEMKFQLIWLSHPRSKEICPRTNAVSSCRIIVSGDRRYFGHGSRKCSSDMRLLNVYCGVAMIEVCLWSKKSAIRWVFGPHPPLNRQGPDRRLFFCAAFTSYYEESDRGQTITAKKTTKSPISNQKTQEYIKGKCPLFIL